MGAGFYPRPWAETQPQSWPAPDPDMRLRSGDPDVQRWLDAGHSLGWCEWYQRFCSRWQYGRAAKITKREEYALFVVSASGPAVDRLAKKYCPPSRKRGVA